MAKTFAVNPCALAMYFMGAFTFFKAGIIVAEAKFPAPIIPNLPLPTIVRFSPTGTTLSIVESTGNFKIEAIDPCLRISP